jgi:hypothetical protein
MRNPGNLLLLNAVFESHSYTHFRENDLEYFDRTPGLRALLMRGSLFREKEAQ